MQTHSGIGRSTDETRIGMEHYKLILAYDGTHFQGFQRQGSARTVQLELESALRSLGWEGKSILSSGRTDTGVHASGQVVAFELDWSALTFGSGQRDQRQPAGGCGCAAG